MSSLLRQSGLKSSVAAVTLLDRDHRDHLTAATRLTVDVINVFVHLASHSRLPKINRVLLAPVYRQRKMLEKINKLGCVAASGGVARMLAKRNALTNEALICALFQARQKGVKIELVVRGACNLPAQLPGITDNIRVRFVADGGYTRVKVEHHRQTHGAQAALMASYAGHDERRGI